MIFFTAKPTIRRSGTPTYCFTGRASVLASREAYRPPAHRLTAFLPPSTAAPTYRPPSPWPVLFGLTLAAVLYFSLVPGSLATTIPFLPAGIVAWLFHHDFVKNMAGFGALAFAGINAWENYPILNLTIRFGKSNCICLPLGKLLMLFCAFVVLLEIVQLRVPGRQCDWRDVLAGWLAGGIVWGGYCWQRMKFIG